MDASSRELCQSLIVARQHNAAWQLLAAQKAPLILSCLKPLLGPDSGSERVRLEDAEQRLADMLGEHANRPEFEVDADSDLRAAARKDLRDWLRRGLITERGGVLSATDALQQVFGFTEGLQNRMMTSTASRLATVQREIEVLETRLNPDSQSRAAHLRSKIETLEDELAQVEAGNVPVLNEAEAVEGMREVYSLARSLHADFRRVEDSYREADRQLRRKVIGDQHHRGEIVDSLLDSHDSLLETPQGQVFHGFHEQLSQISSVKSSTI